MQVDIIEGYEALAGLEQNWRSVYDADPEAQFFLSWTWIARFIETESGQFLTLAAKPEAGDTDYVAFFPIGLGTTPLDKGGFITEVHLAAAGASDYAGFICRPEFDEAAIPGFARTINSIRWARLHIGDVLASDRRFDLFLRNFPKSKFKIARTDTINPVDGFDRSISPRITLPDNWDDYLSSKLSTNTRQKARRFLNKIDGDDAYQVSYADEATIERDLGILIDLWAQQWRPRKGDRTDFMAAFFKKMLGHCFDENALCLPILWHRDAPLAALGNLIDSKNKSLMFLVGGRDGKHHGPPAGFVLHAHCIRYAIERGFRFYDLLQGNEPYKYSFGAQDRHLKNLTVSTKTVGTLAKSLDDRCLPKALLITRQMHKQGHLAEAERGYRQILSLNPRHAIAVQGYGNLLVQRGNRAAAEKLIKSFRAQQG